MPISSGTWRKRIRDSNPDVFRIALKLATGAGKTTVMAMLIGWQAVNAARSPNSKQFSRGFLIITPGITIKDRLRVLLPSGEDSYYASRDLVPPDMLIDLQKAKIVITNYHVFQRRRALETNQTGERLLQGRTGTPVEVLETEGEMLRRACGDLLTLKNVVVLNDEAHHCYRERAGDSRGGGAAEGRRSRRRRNRTTRPPGSGSRASRRSSGRSASEPSTISRRPPSSSGARDTTKVRSFHGSSPIFRSSMRSSAAS